MLAQDGAGDQWEPGALGALGAQLDGSVDRVGRLC